MGNRQDDIKSLADTARDLYGAIDIAVNSAALPVISLISEVTPEQLQAGVNLPLSGGNHLTGMPRLDEIPTGQEACKSDKTA